MNIKSLENVEVKEKKVKNVLQKVTYVLKGYQSAWATKLAARYDEIDNILKELKEERDKMNQEVKDFVDELFEEEDKTVTRVIETCSLVITVGKHETATYEDFDTEGFIEEVYNLLPDLKETLDKLKEAYTTTSVIEKSPKLSIKTVKDKNLTESKESLMSRLKNFVNLVVNQISKKLDKFDMKYDMLLAKYDL